MGESDRYLDYKVKKHRFTLGQPDNALVWLFVFNIVFFLILLTIKAAIAVSDNSDAAFYAEVVQWFQLPADVNQLYKKPWTILSFMFSDVQLYRALSNMLWLWVFGSVFQNLTGNKKIIPLYIYGGLAAALFFITANYLIPSNRLAIESASLLGANASVMAVAVAATVLAPNYRFFRHIRKGVPIWIITVFYVFVNLAGVAAQPAAQAIAHIAGGLAGYFFVYFLRQNKDGSNWMNALYYWFINMFNPNGKNNRSATKQKVFYNTGDREPYNKTSNITPQRVDEILDKINQKGYQYLTNEEKEILKKASED